MYFGSKSDVVKQVSMALWFSHSLCMLVVQAVLGLPSLNGGAVHGMLNTNNAIQ